MTTVTPSSGRGPRLLLVLHPDPVARPVLDDRAVPVDREPVDDRLGDHRSDALDGGEVLGARLGDGGEAAVRPCHRLGGRGPDMADRQRDHHPPQRPLLGDVELFEQRERSLGELRSVLAGARPAHEVVGSDRSASRVEGEQVALVRDEPGVEQRDGGLVAQALDVERRAGPEAEEPLAQLGRARPRVGAPDVGVALLLGAQRRCRTRGTASP